jgi:hypothetical protein
MRAAETLAHADEIKAVERKAIRLRIAAVMKNLLSGPKKNSVPWWDKKT